MLFLSSFIVASSLFLSVSSATYPNTQNANNIVTGAKALPAGNYRVTNVATKQTLSFIRQTVTNVFPQVNGTPLALQFSGKQARLSGGNNKCISAQWNATLGLDNAAVSYACAVGNGTSGTATLEKTKQWWYLSPVPAPTSGCPTKASYYLIAMDHIQDMRTRAIGSTQIATVGGYTSTLLPLFAAGDLRQQWTFDLAA